MVNIMEMYRLETGKITYAFPLTGPMTGASPALPAVCRHGYTSGLG